MILKRKFQISLIILFLSFFILPSVSFAEVNLVANQIQLTGATLDATGLEPNKNVKFTLRSKIGEEPYYLETGESISDNNGASSLGFVGLTPGVEYVANIQYSGENAVLKTITFSTLIGAEVGVNITEPRQTTIELEAKNLLPNKNVLFELKNLDPTPTYSQSKTSVSNNNGIATSNFSGLSPGGDYVGTAKYSLDGQIIGTVQFHTFDADPDPDPDIDPNSDSKSGSGSIEDFGGGLVPCGTKYITEKDSAGKETKRIENPCEENGFKYLLDMINTVVSFLLFQLALPIAAIMFAYAGFLLVTSGGETSKRSKAKSIFTNVAIGLVLAAAAWLIINTILSILGFDGSWIGFK